jgi:hypothetical protein
MGPQLALRPAARRQAAGLNEFEWKDPNDPCQQKGSAIGCETQTLQEAVPVTGTGSALHYSTDRTPGWKVGETIQIPIVGATIPPRLKGIQLTVDVGGEKIEKRWCDPSFPTTGASTCKDYPLITPNISVPYHWDGKDAYDRTVQGRVTATIQVIYVYEFNYYGASDDFASSFSQFGSDTEVGDGRYSCGNVSGTMDTHFFCGIPVGQTITRAIGSWDARPTHGLGGWSLSDHHAYDPVERALHRGDGATIRAEALPPVVNKVAGTTNTGVGSGRGGANFPKDGQLATEANIDYMGDYVRSPDGNLYLHNGLNRNDIFPDQPRRQDLRVRGQRLQGPGDDRRRRPGEERRARRRLRAGGHSRRLAADRVLQRRQLRAGDPQGEPGWLEDRDDRRQRDRPDGAAGRRQPRARGPHRPGQ